MKKTFQWKEFLRTHPIFGTLRDNKRIDALLQDDVSSERLCAKDEVIVRQGEVGISVFLIGAGTAEATLELSEGPPISLSVMRKGDLFGEMALLDHEQRSATVRAKEPCTILEFDGREFEQLMVEYPEIAVSPPVNDKSAAQEHGRADPRPANHERRREAQVFQPQARHRAKAR